MKECILRIFDQHHDDTGHKVVIECEAITINPKNKTVVWVFGNGGGVARIQFETEVELEERS